MLSVDDATVAQYVKSLFPSLHDLHVEQVIEGVSTIVYRIHTAEYICYLRLSPDADISLAAEVAVHRQLTALGLHVPHVLHFEPHHPLFQRSLMLISAIPGRAIGYTQQPPRIDTILPQAGRELARINQIPVQGYGWVNGITPTINGLVAEYASPVSWLQAHFMRPVHALVNCDALSGQDVERLLLLLDRAGGIFADEPAVLAHGDFDVTHIYFQHDVYTGMIDFGEIRGTHWLYDLSHFAIENGKLLPYLLAGYQELRPLTPQDMNNLKLTSGLIAARRIGRRILQDRLPHRHDVEYVVGMLATD